MASSTSTPAKESPENLTAERASELRESLAEIRAKVEAYQQGASESDSKSRTLVAVSKYKPSSDILVCYEEGQRDFGENYVQELVDKAKELPLEIQWHFIGTFQSNKAKLLAAIPNLYYVQTISSEKAAVALNKALSQTQSCRTTPLNVLIQINTSGEDVKGGLEPLSSSSSSSSTPSSNSPNGNPAPSESPLLSLARTIITSCPNLRLQGLMTIGALDASLNADAGKGNKDFDKLKETRDVLEGLLHSASDPDTPESAQHRWGEIETDTAGSRRTRLLLSMGMSADFEAALEAGSDVVRVGTGIFGGRKTKEEVKAGTS